MKYMYIIHTGNTFIPISIVEKKLKFKNIVMSSIHAKTFHLKISIWDLAFYMCNNYLYK